MNRVARRKVSKRPNRQIRMGARPNQQSSQSQNQQSGQTQEQVSGQAPRQQPSQTPNRPVVSAEQLISILEREPLVLEDVRSLVAKRTNQTTDSVRDEIIYERIRDDVSLRDLIMRILIRRGYGPELVKLSDNPLNPPIDHQPVTNSRRSAVPPPPPAYQNPDNPQVEQRLSPYMNMPSLTDLYSQFPVTRPKLRRFGSEAFLIGNENASPNRAGTPNQLPMDLPGRSRVRSWTGRQSDREHVGRPIESTQQNHRSSGAGRLT